MTDGHRTNNVFESRNNGFRHLVGHKHPSIWVATDCLKKDSAMVETENLQYEEGRQPAKRIRTKTISYQKSKKRKTNKHSLP